MFSRVNGGKESRFEAFLSTLVVSSQLKEAVSADGGGFFPSWTRKGRLWRGESTLWLDDG